MIADELSQGAKETILKAVRKELGLKYNIASQEIVDELDKTGYGCSFGRGPQFVLTSKTIEEIMDILKAVFEATKS